MAGVVDPVGYWRRRAFAGAKLAGLTRSERNDIAEMILKRDVSSYKSLNEEELRRLCDAFEGHWFILVLLMQR